jgi:hypothetical protein
LLFNDFRPAAIEEIIHNNKRRMCS